MEKEWGSHYLLAYMLHAPMYREGTKIVREAEVNTSIQTDRVHR